MIDYQVCRSLIDDICEWIGINLSPDDVFDESSLREWALDNGYVKEADHEQD